MEKLKIEGLIKLVEELKPKVFILINIMDYDSNRTEFQKIFDFQENGDVFYNEYRVLISTWAEKGIIRTLPVSLLERPYLKNFEMGMPYVADDFIENKTIFRTTLTLPQWETP